LFDACTHARIGCRTVTRSDAGLAAATAGRVQVDRDGPGGSGQSAVPRTGTTATIDITITDLQVTGDTVPAQLSARIDRYAHGITAARGLADRHLDVHVQLVATRQE
jgi:hypothetical protein